jgi:hypothetical protein
MSLYGRTDSNTNKTKAGVGIAKSSITPTVVFVDETEAKLNENRTRGIDGPGWWSYYTYTDASGATRHKAEKMVALANPDTNANETQADDTIAADLASAITISVQPADQTENEGDPAAFAVTAAATTGTLAYQWQRRTSTSGRWTNVSATLDGSVYTDFTTDTLLISDVTGLDAYEYRVKLTSSAGAEEIISDAATLTATPAP